MIEFLAIVGFFVVMAIIFAVLVAVGSWVTDQFVKRQRERLRMGDSHETIYEK